MEYIGCVTVNDPFIPWRILRLAKANSNKVASGGQSGKSGRVLFPPDNWFVPNLFRMQLLLLKNKLASTFKLVTRLLGLSKHRIGTQPSVESVRNV